MQVDKETLIRVGDKLRGKLETFMADRYLLEQQWLRNLRQYQATYDREILDRIPVDKSKAYPRNTRVKVKALVAKLMEMMFPAKKKNWSLSLSANPSIPEAALQSIIEQLDKAVQEQGGQVTSSDIERAVRDYADARRKKMEAEIQDQIDDADVDYPALARKAIQSGAIFGPGIVRCPMVRTQVVREWVSEGGKWVAKKKRIRRPYPEFVRIWDAYPDLTAKRWEDQDAFFERFVFMRRDLEDLAKRGDFEGDRIRAYLREHPQGNYSPQSFETELQTIAKTANVNTLNSRKYEAYRMLGFVTAQDLVDAGAEIEEMDMHKSILADIWFIDNVIIKAIKAPFGERPSDQYHCFIYAEDEDAGITGIGLPEDLRDSQMGLCAATRCMFDNMASVAGPVYEVNKDLLPSSRMAVPRSIKAFDVIIRESQMQGDSQYPAVRAITTPSHIPELLNILADQRQQLDIESNLPSFLTGNMNQQLGEAFRTTSNMSMMRGGAELLSKDVVRSFDRMTAGVIGAMLKWNMEFNPKEDIKGDYNVQPEGAISLVAKEIRGAALDQLIATLSPEDRAMYDMYGINVDRLEARDLPTNRLLPRDQAEQMVENLKQQAANAAAIEQGLTDAKTQNFVADARRKNVEADIKESSADAVVAELAARVEEKLANVGEKQNKVQLDNLKMLLDVMKGQQSGGTNGLQGEGGGGAGMAPGPQEQRV